MPRNGESQARPGNGNAAQPRRHTDTVRLVMVDLDGVREGLMADARRQQSLAREVMEQARAAYHRAVEVARLMEETREALDALDHRFVRAA